MAHQNYIKDAAIGLLGVLEEVFVFEPGLNIISGENGTLKTRILSTLKTGKHTTSIPNVPARIMAISPKRNSERRESKAIVEQLRSSNLSWESHIGERLQSNIKDSGYETYQSLGDLFHLIFNHRRKDGGVQKDHMEAVRKEFNTVIQTVFPQYTLIAEWDPESGNPSLKMEKNDGVQFQISGLSLGELEILSLIAFIYAQRDQVDVYLIDEPEVHLNWHLEDRLFIFLRKLCVDYRKQMIVVTHSRTIFLPEFLPCVQFLHWDAGKVKLSRSLTPAQRTKLAGDVVQVLDLTGSGRPTYHVEDASHRLVLTGLAELYGGTITINECGNSSNVKSLYEYSKVSGGWTDNYFLIDGDNQGNPFPSEAPFIHLPIYCIENALLDPDLVAIVAQKPISDVQGSILSIIKRQRKKISKGNLFFESLLDKLLPNEITFAQLASLDGSLIFEGLATWAGYSTGDFIRKYLTIAETKGAMPALFPAALVESIKKAAPAKP